MLGAGEAVSHLGSLDKCRDDPHIGHSVMDSPPVHGDPVPGVGGDRLSAHFWRVWVLSALLLTLG